ncbi:extensin-like [Rana temporaria]|uniref:extensin-like n=1 Tax=Rana temporaria TaxID=8407 RepID=UPI001AAE092C|nr:extensin-like [Rana temporaria]
MLKLKWKSIRDAYARQLRAQREQRRSGSGACSVKEYVHAKELEFLRPVLDLGSTESCWDEAATAVVDIGDRESVASGDQAMATLEPEPQHSEASNSNATRPLAEQSPVSIAPIGPPRALRRRAPAPDPALDRMLDIMTNMSDRMNNRSYGQNVAKCLGELIDKVPPNLQAVVLSCTARYISTFIPPTEADDLSEPPPPYGPYANKRTEHVPAPPTTHFSPPPVTLWTGPQLSDQPPRPTPPPTSAHHPLTTTLSHLPPVPTPSTHTSLNPFPYTQPSSYHPHSPFPHLSTPPVTYTNLPPTTLSSYHPPPSTYPATTTTPTSHYPHRPRQSTFRNAPTRTPPPPQATPPSNWSGEDSTTSTWPPFAHALSVAMSPHGEEDSSPNLHQL